VEFEDIILSRYGDMTYILSLSIRRGYELYNKAIKEKNRDKTYNWWLARLPQYSEDNYESFNDFYEKVYPPSVQMDMRSKEDIMEELLGK